MTAFSNGRENEYFYASLYAGLYYESQVSSPLPKPPYDIFRLMSFDNMTFKAEIGISQVKKLRLECICKQMAQYIPINWKVVLYCLDFTWLS